MFGLEITRSSAQVVLLHTMLPVHTVYAGNPARFVKTTEDFQQQHINGYKSHFVTNRPWREITQFRDDEWDNLRLELGDSYGYIVRKKKGEQ